MIYSYIFCHEIHIWLGSIHNIIVALSLGRVRFSCGSVTEAQLGKNKYCEVPTPREQLPQGCTPPIALIRGDR